MATNEADADQAGAAPEPRLFLVRLEGRKQPAYAICERTAMIELPADISNRLGANLFKRVDDFFRDQTSGARAWPSVAIPAELDPKGGGYLVALSSMGDSHTPGGGPDGDGDGDGTGDGDNDNGKPS